MIRLFKIWLVISAFYYVDTLLTGHITQDYTENVPHKMVKYIACAIFSIYFIFKSKNVFGAIVTACLFLLSLITLLINGQTTLSSTVMLTTASMIGLYNLLNTYRHDVDTISSVIFHTGCLVGIFSFIEMLFFADKFISYWQATGGIRSISTLFNPNNLGLYLGVCLILAPTTKIKLIKKIILLIPIIFGLFMSGSRTSWVALTCILIFQFLFDRKHRNGVIKFTQKRPTTIITALTIILCGVTFANYFIGLVDIGDIDSEFRGASLYTADIRISNFNSYLSSIGWQTLIPDFADQSISHIQDNFYLIIINTFGIVITVFGVIFFLSTNRITAKEGDDSLRMWRWVFAYYLISGLSGAFINTFPNNQIFFLSLGAVFIPTIRRQSKRIDRPV